MKHVMNFEQFLIESQQEREIQYLEENALLHATLDLVGFIPGLGEVADAANAILYIRKKNWLFAALSLIAIIPELGDLLGKSAKLGQYLSKTAKAGSNVGKATKMLAKFARGIRRLKSWLSSNYHMVEKVFDAIRNSNGRTESKIKPHLPEIEGALKAFLLDREAAKQYA